jgi:hypothetical protein
MLFGHTTPSLANQPSPHFRVRPFVQSDATFRRVRESSVLTLAWHGELDAPEA